MEGWRNSEVEQDNEYTRQQAEEAGKEDSASRGLLQEYSVTPGHMHTPWTPATQDSILQGPSHIDLESSFQDAPQGDVASEEDIIEALDKLKIKRNLRKRKGKKVTSSGKRLKTLKFERQKLKKQVEIYYAEITTLMSLLQEDKEATQTRAEFQPQEMMNQLQEVYEEIDNADVQLAILRNLGQHDMKIVRCNDRKCTEADGRRNGAAERLSDLQHQMDILFNQDD